MTGALGSGRLDGGAAVAEAPRSGRADSGAAVAEFVLVSAVLVMTALGVAQVALVLHVRNVVTADAAEGARRAASLGAAPAVGGPYAQRLVAGTVPGAARRLRCTSVEQPGAVPLVAVTCRGRVALSLMPLGFSVPISLTAHAVRERPP